MASCFIGVLTNCLKIQTAKKLTFKNKYICDKHYYLIFKSSKIPLLKGFSFKVNFINKISHVGTDSKKVMVACIAVYKKGPDATSKNIHTNKILL